MWIFTPSGFLSVVADRRRPGHALARVAGDLEAFCGRTGAPAPVETPDRDYRYRTSVPLAVLAADLAAQAEAIDYPNFKAAVARRQGRDRAHRSGRVWSVMHDLQEDAVRTEMSDLRIRIGGDGPVVAEPGPRGWRPIVRGCFTDGSRPRRVARHAAGARVSRPRPRPRRLPRRDELRRHMGGRVHRRARNGPAGRRAVRPPAGSDTLV
jgi:hypothetical protein